MIGANSLSKSASEPPKKPVLPDQNGESSDTDASVADERLEDSMTTYHSSISGEIPFLAMLPSISSLDDEDEFHKPLIEPDALEEYRLSARLKKHLPRRVYRSVKYVTTGRFPKYVKIGLLGLATTFAAHMLCIAVGMYQISLIRPESVQIKRLHLKGLDSAHGVLEAEVFVPMPWMARFFHINVVRPHLDVQTDTKETLITAEFPDVIVGSKGAKIEMNGVKFNSRPDGKISPLSVILQQFLPLGLVRHRPVKKLKILATARLQTYSFWCPLDIGVNLEKTLDLAELKEQLMKKDPESEASDKPNITKIRLENGGSDSLETRVVVTVKLPPNALTYFMTIDVPALEGELSLIPSNRPLSESEPLYLGKVSDMNFSLQFPILLLGSDIAESVEGGLVIAER